MPYFFKLSDKKTFGYDFKSVLNFEWLAKVLFVAGDVANHCRDENVSVYIIESIEHDGISDHYKYEYYTPKGISKHRTLFIGTISKKTITELEADLTNMLSKCLQYRTGKKYNLLKYESCIHNEIKKTLVSLDNINPIKQLYKSYNDNGGITHMMHMTCSDRDSSISENGLYSERKIKRYNLQLLNGPDLTYDIPVDFLEALDMDEKVGGNGNCVKNNNSINKRLNRTKQKLTKKRLYKKKKYV
jgi:hypothetical protein